MNILSRLVRSPYTLFIAISLLVLGPGLQPGYLFLVDMPWPEQFDLANYTQNGLRPHVLLTAAFWLLSQLVPAWIIQKILLIGILSGAGAATYKLSLFLIQKKRLAMLSGTLAILNPFVAERLASGQWLVLAGYALLPLSVVLLLNLLEKQSKKSYIYFAVLCTIYPMVSTHWWYIATPLLALIALIYLKPTQQSIRHAVKPFLLLAAGFILINSFWIFSVGGSDGQVSGFNATDFTVFQTRADSDAGLELTVLAQYGFWNDRAALPNDGPGMWWVLYGFVTVMLALVGAERAIRCASKTKRSQALKSSAVALVIAAPIAYLLALGYAHPVGNFVIDIFRIIPGFDGLRETAKLIGVISLFVALFAPFGFSWITEKVSGQQRVVLWTSMVVLAVFALSGMLFGMNGQLRSYEYPQSYREVRNIVKNIDGEVLTLPWLTYLELDFADSAYTVNPGAVYFTSNVDSSSLIGNSLIDDPTDFDREVLKIPDQAWVDAVTAEGYSHVLILKTDAWSNYLRLLQTEEVVYDSDEIALIKL